VDDEKVSCRIHFRLLRLPGILVATAITLALIKGEDKWGVQIILINLIVAYQKSRWWKVTF